jgi:PD-(D/E)XK endonuclease
MFVSGRLNRHLRRQGDLGEAAAIEYLTRAGANVFVPLFHSPDCDLVADCGDRLVRVQVKTCTRRYGRRWSVTLCTRGGNQSWTGVVKRFHPGRCDYLFVLVEDGRRWFIPSAAVDGGTAIVLGGPKYAAYELAPPSTGLPALDSGVGLRGSVGVGEPSQTVNLVAKPEGVRIPPPPLAGRGS